MENIAIIPARSGSKGLKDKNIRLLCGKPLLLYSIEAALNSCMFKTVMVSTDSSEYADISIKHGAEVPFLRSEQNSSDYSGSWDVVKEVLTNYLNIGNKFDTICLLQPTSPLRTPNDIISAYRFFETQKADSVTSVCECDHSPQLMMTLPNDLSLGKYRSETKDLPRQLTPVYYRLNGSIFIRKIEYSDNEIQILNSHEYAFIMNRSRSIDIDNIDDFEYAEFIMNKR